LKRLERILVHRSPQQPRLYLFSLNPRKTEAIIPKNAEPDPEFPGILRRERER